MRISGDYHLHTFSSDGRATISRHLAAAKKLGLSQIAITDHSFQTLLCHLTDKKFAAQRELIADLKNCNVDILHGVEGNIVGHRLDVPHSVIKKCDVLIAGFHRYILPKFAGEDMQWVRTNGFGSRAKKEKLICQNTEAYLFVMENYPVDVIAHLGHLAPVDFESVCNGAAKHGVYIELNEKHIDVLGQGINAVLKSDVKLILGSDAHSAKRTGKFNRVEAFAKECGIPVERIYGTDGRPPVFKDKRDWTYGRDV